MKAEQCVQVWAHLQSSIPSTKSRRKGAKEKRTINYIQDGAFSKENKRGKWRTKPVMVQQSVISDKLVFTTQNECLKVDLKVNDAEAISPKS